MMFYYFLMFFVLVEEIFFFTGEIGFLVPYNIRKKKA